MVYKPKTTSPSTPAPAQVANSRPSQSPTQPNQAAAPLAPLQVSPQAIAAAQAKKQAADVNGQAQQLHQLINQITVQKHTTGSPATLVVGVENAASLRLGSSRYLATDGGFWKGVTYPSLEGGIPALQAELKKLKAGGQMPAVMEAYEKLYGTSLTAVLGEQVRNPQERQALLAALPPPISEAQLTKDAFIEQIAVQYVYQNNSADALNASQNDGRRGSSPKDILGTFGYRAGPPISGKWGFQMRVFVPVDPKSGKLPIVAFRGTEGISFDVKEKPEGTLDTIIGDFSPAGVGYNQYQQNHELIKRNMDAAASQGKVIITGHSLGGAIAQIAATEFRQVTSEVVTFQSAAISQQDVNRMKAYNAANPRAAVKSRHYRVDGDVVPNAGEADLPGEIHYFDRMTKPKGANMPYQMDLSYDTIDLTRAQGGHVSPMLSTYLHGQKPQNAQQAVLNNKGIRDESTMGQNAQDVQMVYGGRYSTEKDPRLQLESRRTTTMVKAMNMSSMYESVYYDQIAYNTLLAKVEEMAVGKKYATYADFRAAATELINSLSGHGRLPLTQKDAALGQQLKLPRTEKDYAHPIATSAMMPVYPLKDSQFAEMQKTGVLITEAVAQRVRRELPMLWDAWHPEGAK